MTPNESQPSSPTTLPGENSVEANANETDLAGALERSLNATLDQQQSTGDATFRQPLLQVAQEFKGLELCVSPILMSLVAAATESLRLPSSSFRDEMNLAVAETIFNDTSSRQRMEQFWHRLQQEELA